MASSALQDLPGYDLYAAAQMPFGAHSADFACAQSYTSKYICELPGNLTVSLCTFLTACRGSCRLQTFNMLSLTPPSSSVTARKPHGEIPQHP